MCGIVGYIGARQAQSVLIDSLKRLEYRGYDSAGIAVVPPGQKKMQVHKKKGMIKNLEDNLPALNGTLGISHTRWATHGPPSDSNAHPHVDCKGNIAIVHNGIIENYLELKESLINEGHVFTSETDTEVLAHLIEKYYTNDLYKAMKLALEQVQGSYAILALHMHERDRLVSARNESPLVLGLGIDENFIASDVPAVLKYTDKVVYLDNGEIADVTKSSIKITDFNGKTIERPWHKIEWSLEDAEKGGYEHFMLKEIFEQPRAVREAMLGKLSGFTLDNVNGIEFNSAKILGCGTSYHAGLVGKYILESIMGLPTSIETSSEYRYNSTTLDQPLVILISQSGETADTLAAAREARRRGCKTIGITNVVGSTLTREVDDVMFIRVGPEISVCATKSFTGQIISLYLLASHLSRTRGFLKADEIREFSNALRQQSRLVEQVLNNPEPIKECANKLAKAENVFFIGRNINYPSALEGALKLKEISYIHAEGYQAGELKHGPLALLMPQTPIVAIAVKDHTYDKMISNIEEVTARDSPVIAIGHESDTELEKYVDTVLRIPDVPPLFTPVPVAVVLQLLAYYTARNRGCPIDKPRNLAKSVTVE
ncbi:MAG: glutamine--fructose-6-phosphate transaminase (isomerizing) [Thermoplasmata archaeon]|nr:MAG: glutamine--fructose-6-phosphate transaminase (isomerizing) [Thermoplasmata archaeon]